MGFLDGILNQASSGQSGGGLGGLIAMVTQNPQIMNALTGLLSTRDSSIGGSGGLAGIVEAFQKNGLGDVMSGWISTGPNPPVSAAQVSDVLGSKTIGQFANAAGVPDAQAGSLLAGLLPAAVDHLTPGGNMPETDALEDSLASILSRFRS